MATNFDAIQPPLINKDVQKSRNRLLETTDFISFGVGLLGAVYVNVSGNLYLAEICLLLLLPYLLFRRGGLLRFRYPKLTILLGIGWLLNQIVTDLYRGTSAMDILKGWALIAIFLTNLMSLYLLVFPYPRRLALGLLGHAMGSGLQIVLQPTSNMLINQWKFGGGYAVILLVVILSIFLVNKNQRRAVWCSVFLGFLALYSFYLHSRSLGGITLLTAFVIGFRYTRIGKISSSRINDQVGIILSVVLIIGTGWGVIQLYGYMSEQGYLGEGARYQYQEQASGSLGIIIGGRQEWLPAAHAIMDSPIIGYGSYARNTEYGQYFYELSRLGYNVDLTQLDKYLASIKSIPTHSHILQGWVWAGLVGGAFWLFVLGLVILAIVRAYHYPSAFFVVIVFVGFSAVWDILFSPLSNAGRLHFAFILVTLSYTMFWPDRGVKKL